MRDITTKAQIVSRRTLLIGAGASTLVGCTNGGLDTMSTGSVSTAARSGTSTPSVIRPAIGVDKNLSTMAAMYGPMEDNGFQLAGIPYEKLDQRFRRQRVVNRTGMPPNTIVVDPHNHHAYFILSHDEAVRYGVGVGKAGFEWAGDAVISRKATWPTWTPPAEMIERRPDLAQWAGGQPGGLENPLGARALYLYSNGRDTLYRLHGTPEWSSIGKSMSSGCIRFLNQDIIDLHRRVPNGTRVRVLGA